MSLSDLLWTLAFTMIVMLAVLGNLTVLWIVIGRAGSRSVSVHEIFF